MLRRIVHIVAVCLAGIITGAQYLVSLDYRRADMSPSFYTEKLQYAIHHGGYVLFATLIAATAATFAAALLYRNDRRTCYLLAGAGVCFLVGGLITKFGNIPLLDLMDTWSISSPPANWAEIADRWYLFHSVRFAVDIVGLLLAVFSTFTRRENV